MDQILAHLILAGHPGQTWDEIVATLQATELPAASIAALAVNLQAPRALDNLLSHLQPGYAVALLAQCRQLAQLNGVINAEEERILQMVAQHFGIKLIDNAPALQASDIADFLEFRTEAATHSD